MKKTWLAVGGIVAVAAIVAGVVWWMLVKPGQNVETKTATNTQAYTAKDACNFLTQPVANDVLGAGAQKGTVSGNASSEDVSVSTCIYTSAHDNTLEGVKGMRTASLLVRAPLSEAGQSSNRQPFEPMKPGAQNVPGYGEMAFWDPSTGQLNVYVKGAWLILSMGKASLADRTLTEAKTLADKIVPAYR